MMPHPRLLPGLCIVLAGALLGAASADAASDDEWQAAQLRDHALVGKIWDATAKRFISREQLVAKLAMPQFVLLGETHDNPDHHRLQDDILDALVAVRTRPALAMEQLDHDHQSAIDAVMTRTNGLNADVVADAGQLNRKRWGWPMYRSLLETAITYRLPVAAANLSREGGRKVFAQGLGVLSAPYDAALFAATWNPVRNSALHKELVDSHCGKLDEAMAPGMINAQRARDAVMAEALLPYAKRGAVLIAGSGHARKDRGVPVYLSHRLPDTRTVSITFVEVEAGKPAVADYAQSSPDAYDYLWFTPRAERPDPCKGMTIRPVEPPKS